MNTHGLTVNYGKHKDKLFTRIPLSYLKWMVNSNANMSRIAKAELERRGDTLPTVEISGHAIDKASLRVLRIWQATKEPDEGLYSWLSRMTLEAIEKGIKLEDGKTRYQGMKFVIHEGEEFPVLKTVVK